MSGNVWLKPAFETSIICKLLADARDNGNVPLTAVEATLKEVKAVKFAKQSGKRPLKPVFEKLRVTN